jgi:hypothetical protein
MAETQTVPEKAVEACRVCGSVRFNPMCAECREVLEESLLLGVEAEPNPPQRDSRLRGGTSNHPSLFVRVPLRLGTLPLLTHESKRRT